MSEDGIEREMHSDLYNMDVIKFIKNTPLIKSNKPPKAKESNITIKGTKDNKSNSKEPW
jgi:hypothetical protein